MLGQLRRVVARAPANDGADGAHGATGATGANASWHVIDLCCGKAFFATLRGL